MSGLQSIVVKGSATILLRMGALKPESKWIYTPPPTGSNSSVQSIQRHSDRT